jgi:hypothetical protein
MVYMKNSVATGIKNDEMNTLGFNSFSGSFKTK